VRGYRPEPQDALRNAPQPTFQRHLRRAHAEPPQEILVYARSTGLTPSAISGRSFRTPDVWSLFAAAYDHAEIYRLHVIQPNLCRKPDDQSRVAVE
jgi:hypothetical protein